MILLALLFYVQTAGLGCAANGGDCLTSAPAVEAPHVPEKSPECVATSNIQEMKAKVGAACRPGLVSFDLSGDHDTLTETLVLDKDFNDRDLYESRVATYLGATAARQSAQIAQGLYASKRFVFQVRDRKLRPLCHFTVTDQVTTGACGLK